MKCLVFGCTNSSDQGYLLHKYPKAHLRKWQWYNNILKANEGAVLPLDVEERGVCEVHFTKNCYYKISSYYKSKSKKILKEEAVPTLYLRYDEAKNSSNNSDSEALNHIYLEVKEGSISSSNLDISGTEPNSNMFTGKNEDPLNNIDIKNEISSSDFDNNGTEQNSNVFTGKNEDPLSNIDIRSEISSSCLDNNGTEPNSSMFTGENEDPLSNNDVKSEISIEEENIDCEMEPDFFSSMPCNSEGQNREGTLASVSKDDNSRTTRGDVWASQHISPSSTQVPSRPFPSNETEYETVKKKLENRSWTFDKSEFIKFILCPEDESSEDENRTSDVEEHIFENEFETQEDVIAAAQQMKNVEVFTASDDDDGTSSNPSSLLNSSVPIPSETKASENDNWCKGAFYPPKRIRVICRDTLLYNISWMGQSPLYFFNLIFDNVIIRHITLQTSKYAMLKDKKDLKLSEAEMKSYLGVLMISGIIKVPNYRTYWKTVDSIARSITLDRFEEITRYLRFNHNIFQKPKDHPYFDKLHKIRPLLERIGTNCRNVPQEEHQCIDEQIIPTKALISLKHNNPKKPHKWGYKVFARAGASGYIYDFEVYTGKLEAQDNGLEIRSDVVLRLAEGIPKHRNYKLYYDHLLSSIPLTKKLKYNGIFSLSTISPSRLKGCSLKEENHLKNEGRGSLDHRIETDENILAIKWFDNKSIHFLSTYAGLRPTSKETRWDHKERKPITIPTPYAVTEYKNFKGGVELCDMLMNLYKIDFKSKKWYVRIFYYLLDLSVVNAWLLYRRTIYSGNSSCVSLCDFKQDIAFGLLNSEVTSKKEQNLLYNSPRKRNKFSNPVDSTTLDNIGHLPSYVMDKRKCKNCITNSSRVICEKCNVGLCLTNKRNCFKKYHENYIY